MHSVVVRNNKFEGRLHMLSPLVFTLGFSPRAVVNGFFAFLNDCFFELKRDLVARLHVGCIAPSVATCLMLNDDSIAKQQGVLGVYLVRFQTTRKSSQDNRQGALADGLHGLNPRNTAHRHTPVQKATSVGLATGKAHSISGGKLGCVYKRTNPSSALGAIFVYRCMEEPGEGGLIHPRYTYV